MCLEVSAELGVTVKNQDCKASVALKAFGKFDDLFFFNSLMTDD